MGLQKFSVSRGANSVLKMECISVHWIQDLFHTKTQTLSEFAQLNKKTGAARFLRALLSSLQP